jgi:hypothetical protein
MRDALLERDGASPLLIAVLAILRFSANCHKTGARSRPCPDATKRAPPDRSSERGAKGRTMQLGGWLPFAIVLIPG